MKKLMVSVVIIGLFLIYSLMHAQGAPVAILPKSSGSANAATSTPAAPTTDGGAPAPTATSVPGALYRDGSYTGSTDDAQWGVIQVKAIIQGGKITDVQFLQYPNERSRSVEINNYADPILTSEAIQAQSAQVDAVSGATDSSIAFAQSLSDALASAQTK